ncbi:hypothetical protein [Sphingobium sp. WCS2017Hpa-17]|uniref:hypothetical protein n=1 Tax=Sphingobium sp. WCS2017Hpa-17 TaxID=3073638 RepID=UPI00288AA1D7|nr:hypothetical protein [Sphingobium sp. WCS2017Hpa-17]
MHIIRTWPELADWSGDADIAALLRLRRDQLIDCGDLPDIGTFAIVEEGDTLADIEMALGLIITNGSPAWEWVIRHGSIFEAPVIVSDGFGHVLIVPDAEGIDPDLLALCRDHA